MCKGAQSDVYALLLGSLSAGASLSVDVIDYNEVSLPCL